MSIDTTVSAADETERASEAPRRGLPGPERAWIVTTSKCNLNCVHCARSISEFREFAENTPDMEEAMFETFLQQVGPSLRTVQIGGTNLGEPMFSRKLEDHIDRLLELEHVEEIKLQTNGTYLLNTERMERLVRQGVRIMVSLEGVTERSYENIRGVKFVRVRDALVELKKIRARYPESRSELLLAFTVSYDTLAELVPLVELAFEVGASQVTVSHFVAIRQAHRYQSLVYHRGAANDAFAAAEARARALGVHYVGPEPFDIAPLAEGAELANAVRSEPPCFHPWKSVSVSENGDVMPCCATNTVMGNLTKNDFETIWNSKRYRRLRERVNSSRPPSYCRGCLLRGVDLDSPNAKLYTDESFLLRSVGPDSDPSSVSDLFAGVGRSLVHRVRRGFRSDGVAKRLALALRRFYLAHK